MDWDSLTGEIEELCSKIDFKPQVIVGITRGGVVPARVISTNLNVKDMYCISVKKIGNERKVVTEILDDLAGKEVLLIEDMLETGKSLIVAKQYLESKGAKVKTACLYTMPVSEITPDFFLRQVDSIQRFPWE